MRPAKTSIRLLLSAGLFALGMAQVLAAGLGDIQVESYLNQHLKAKIPLLGLSKSEAKKYSVSLASESDFHRAKVPYPTVLGILRLRMSSGAEPPYISVLSTSPVYEPFLRLLIDLSGPDGKIQREFAVLLDPQGFSGEPQGGENIVVAGDTGRSANKAQELPDFSRSAAGASGSRVSGHASGGGTRSDHHPATYGPVRAGETMWGIASKLRPATGSGKPVSMQQVMIALQKKNPAAFDSKNLNSLRKGSVLKVPSLAEMRGLDPIRAFREAKRQIDGPPRAAPRRASSKTRSPDSRPVDIAAVDIEVTDARLGKTRSGKTMAKPDKAGNKVVDEAAIAARARELEAELLGTIDEPVRSGEAVGGSMEDPATSPSTEGKGDSTLASSGGSGDSGLWQPGVTTPMAGQGGDNTSNETEASAKDIARAMVKEDAANANAANHGAEPGSMEAGQVRSAPDTMKGVAGADKTAPGPGSVATRAADAMRADAEGSKGTVTGDKLRPIKPVVPKRIAPPPVVEPVGAFDGVMDQLFGDPTMLALGGGGIVGVLALVLLLLRRRQNASDEDGYLDDKAEILSVESDEAAGGEAVDPNAATTIMSAADGQGDALTSAQEYIAQGQLDDASRTLEQAVMAEPARDDLRMKLAEVYEKTNNSVGIEALMGQVPQDKRNDDNGLWRVLQAVSTKVAAGSKGVTASGAASMADTTILDTQAPDDEMPDMLDLSDLGLDDDAFDLPELSSGGETVGADELDFDLGDLDISGDAPAEFDLGEDFDLPDFGGDEVSADAGSADELASADSSDADELAAFADSELSLNDAAAADAGLLDADSDQGSSPGADDADAGLDFGDLEAELGGMESGSQDVAGDELSAELAGASDETGNAGDDAFDAGLDFSGLDFGGDGNTASDSGDAVGGEADLAGLDALLGGDAEVDGEETPAATDAFDSSDTLIMDAGLEDELAGFGVETDSSAATVGDDLEGLAASLEDTSEAPADDMGLALDSGDDAIDMSGLNLNEGSADSLEDDLSADFAELAAATDDETLDLGLNDDEASMDGLELSSGDESADDLEAALAGMDAVDGDTGANAENISMDTATLLVQTSENDPLSETVMLGSAVDTMPVAEADSGLATEAAGSEVDSEEVDTKLDLARAYLDMGDPEGARTMLDEVVAEGSASQRNEAQGLIAQLG